MKALIAAILGAMTFMAIDIAIMPEHEINITQKDMGQIVTARMVEAEKKAAKATPTPTIAPTPSVAPEEPLKYSGYVITEDDKAILLRITEAEAGEGNQEQKKNVLTCIFNRVLSDEWPNTIKDVVFQKGQFSPISDGGYDRAVVTDGTIEAYNAWLREGLGHDCVFFCMPNCRSAKSGWFSKKNIEFNDGLHNYYY